MAENFDALNKGWTVITDILSPEKQPPPGTVRVSLFVPIDQCTNVDKFAFSVLEGYTEQKSGFRTADDLFEIDFVY